MAAIPCSGPGLPNRSRNAATVNRGKSCRPPLFSQRLHTPLREQINQTMAGNICRCATYQRIRRAIERAAGETA